MARPRDTAPEPRGASSELYCMDRAFGHDWDEPTWADGPDVKRGRTRIYVHHRKSRCVRCGSTRTEVFEQSARMLEKVANRYSYSQLYRERTRLEPGELRMNLWRSEAGVAP